MRRETDKPPPNPNDHSRNMTVYRGGHPIADAKAPEWRARHEVLKCRKRMNTGQRSPPHKTLPRAEAFTGLRSRRLHRGTLPSRTLNANPRRSDRREPPAGFPRWEAGRCGTGKAVTGHRSSDLNLKTTLCGGSLGSPVDEERSQLRELM